MRATGIVTTSGAALRVGVAVLPLPRAHTAAGQWIAAQVAAIDSGELQPCPQCGAYSCECWEWVELMTAPAPADPFEMTSEDLLY